MRNWLSGNSIHSFKASRQSWSAADQYQPVLTSSKQRGKGNQLATNTETPQFNQLGRKTQEKVVSEEKETTLTASCSRAYSLPSSTWLRQGKVPSPCRRQPGLASSTYLSQFSKLFYKLLLSFTNLSHSLTQGEHVGREIFLFILGELQKQPKWEQQIVPSSEICSAHCTHIPHIEDLSFLHWYLFPQSPSDSVLHHLHYEGWALSLCNKICHSNSSSSSFCATASQSSYCNPSVLSKKHPTALQIAH